MGKNSKAFPLKYGTCQESLSLLLFSIGLKGINIKTNERNKNDRDEKEKGHRILTVDNRIQYKKPSRSTRKLLINTKAKLQDTK